MAKPISSSVCMREGRPTLLINDVPCAPLIYALTDCPGARWTWEEVPARNIGLFASKGVRLFQADVWFEQMIGSEGRLDAMLARKQIAGVLAECPDAAVMLRLHVNATPEWCVENPGECVGYADTTPGDPPRWGLQRPLGTDGGRPVRASFSSKPWLDWAKAHLRDFCAQLAATPEGGSLFCLQIANGLYGEWHQFGFMHHDPDTGVAATKGFREWVLRHYGSAEDAGRAWGTTVDIETLETPDSALRELEDRCVVRDPRTQQMVTDYYTFLHETLGDVVVGLAATVKASWPRPIVTAAFYGYFYGCFGRNAAGAQLDLEKILRSDSVDCLCSPQSYTFATRAFGGSGHSRGILGAVRRAGKLWLDEMDQATSVCGCPWEKGFKSNISDDIAMMRRNVFQPLLRGGGMWWYDFGPVAGTPNFASQGTIGWWDEPQLQEDIRKIVQIAQSRAGRPFVRQADVLVVHDAWAFRHLVARKIPTTGFQFGDPPPVGPDPFSRRAMDDMLEGLYRSGLVADEALLTELPALDLTPYKLVLFATTPALDAAMRACIESRVMKGGRHVAFLGFAGACDGQSADPKNAEALSGFKSEWRTPQPAVSRISLDGAREDQILEAPIVVPSFEAAPGEVVGKWEDGSASAARRGGAESTIWVFAVAPSAPGVLRSLARRAGCHVVNESDDVTLVGDSCLLVHSVDGGSRALTLTSGLVINANLRPRSTTVFDADSGDVLLG